MMYENRRFPPEESCLKPIGDAAPFQFMLDNMTAVQYVQFMLWVSSNDPRAAKLFEAAKQLWGELDDNM